jgi:hypothetical protein
MTPDEKVLNFCQYVQFRFESNALFISEDNALISEACTKGIHSVWNTNTNKRLEDFFSLEGLKK